MKVSLSVALLYLPEAAPVSVRRLETFLHHLSCRRVAFLRHNRPVYRFHRRLARRELPAYLPETLDYLQRLEARNYARPPEILRHLPECPVPDDDTHVPRA